MMSDRKKPSFPIGAALLRLMAIVLLLAVPVSQQSVIETGSAGVDLKVLHAALTDLSRPEPILITPPLPHAVETPPPRPRMQRLAAPPVPRLGVVLWREASHHARAPPLLS